MFKAFGTKVRTGLGNFFNSYLPRAATETNRFIGSLLGAGRTGHRLLTHVNEQVGRSELFTPVQKERLAKAHAFAGTNLQKLSDFGGNVQKFNEGISQFRLT